MKSKDNKKNDSETTEAGAQESASPQGQAQPSGEKDKPGNTSPAPEHAHEHDKAHHKKHADREKEELKDRLLRLQADFDNFRKRMIREKTEIYQRANENLIEELLPVFDHLDMALDACSGDTSSPALLEGVQLVTTQARTVLGKFGLSQIEADGLTFDPTVHEAVSHIPSADVPENTVIKQTRKGYMLGTKVLRAAQVVVSSGVPPEESGRAPAE